MWSITRRMYGSFVMETCSQSTPMSQGWPNSFFRTASKVTDLPFRKSADSTACEENRSERTRTSALGKTDPLCCAQHNGSFLASAKDAEAGSKKSSGFSVCTMQATSCSMRTRVNMRFN